MEEHPNQLACLGCNFRVLFLWMDVHRDAINDPDVPKHDARIRYQDGKHFDFELICFLSLECKTFTIG